MFMLLIFTHTKPPTRQGFKATGSHTTGPLCDRADFYEFLCNRTALDNSINPKCVCVDALQHQSSWVLHGLYIWWFPPAALGGRAPLAPAWTSTNPILCLLFLCSVICKTNRASEPSRFAESMQTFYLWVPMKGGALLHQSGCAPCCSKIPWFCWMFLPAEGELFLSTFASCLQRQRHS